MKTPWPRALCQALPALAAAVALVAIAAPAHAALVISAATQSVSADTSRSDPVAQIGHATAGGFDANAVSMESNVRQPATAVAGIDVVMAADVITGNGQAHLALTNDANGSADSFFEVLFSLTSDTIVIGSAALSGSGNAVSHALFNLDRLGSGGGSVISESDTAPLPAFEGELLAGDYRLRLHASSASIDPNESGLAWFTFSLRFQDRDAHAVPEPQTWLLALLGLAACSALRKKRPVRG